MISEIFKGSSKQPLPTPARPASNVYLCNDNDCDLSLVGEKATELAYGCFMCKPPTRYADLSTGIKALIPTSNVALLWKEPVSCPQHDRPLRPFCPRDYSLIDSDGNIPPVGIWGFSFAGKTAFCAALMMEVEHKLFQMTGVLKYSLFNRGEYEKEVVNPLKSSRGIVPGKTQKEEHRSLVLKLYREGWFRKKVTLTDIGGENYMQWLDTDPADENEQKMLNHMLHTREAVFLMSPESAKGLGATVTPDLYLVAQPVMRILREQGIVAPLKRPEMEALFSKIWGVLTNYQYLFGGGGNSLYQVASEIAVLVGRGDRDDFVNRLEEEMSKADEQMTPIPLEKQLGGLVAFLNRWGAPGADGKLDLRLAITIGKADLLKGVSLKDRKMASQFDTSTGIQAWRDALAHINKLGKTNSKRDWQNGLRRASDAARQVFVEFGEEEFIKLAETSFRDVGFFFVSSLGRDTEAFIEWGAATQMPQMVGGQYSALGGAATPSITPSQPQLQWKLGKRVRISENGVRRPEPQNVLLPLLWILTSD